MSPRDDFDEEDSSEEQPRLRRRRPDADLSGEERAEESPRSRRPRKAPEQAWDDAEQKVKARNKKTADGAQEKKPNKAAQAKRTDKEPATPAKPMDRGKWRAATFRQRLARIRWILFGRYAPAWLFVILLLAYFVPRLFPGTAPLVAPFYTQEVQHWSPDIIKWSTQYGVNPNLIATLMQIESCGYPGAASYVGAQGLFQVMPFNFQPGDNMTLPETNAQRGIGVLRDCLKYSSGDVGLAMACYNGGPGLISRDPKDWPTESQNYYTWGTGIYNDAVRGLTKSATLDDWLQSGGSGLCEQAAAALGLTPSPVGQPSVAPATNASAAQPGNQLTFPSPPPPVIIASPINSTTEVLGGNSSGNPTGAATQTPTLGIRLFLTPNSSP